MKNDHKGRNEALKKKEAVTKEIQTKEIGK